MYDLVFRSMLYGMLISNISKNIAVFQLPSLWLMSWRGGGGGGGKPVYKSHSWHSQNPKSYVKKVYYVSAGYAVV
jgi:hypothetical protein